MSSITHWLHEPLTEVIGWTLVHFVWQGAVVAAVAAVWLFHLRRASASVRYAVASSSLALMAASPVVTLLILLQSMPDHPSSDHEQTSGPASRSVDVLAAGTGLPLPLTRSEPSETVNPASDSPTRAIDIPAATAGTPFLRVDPRQWVPYLVFFWAIGVLALSLRLIFGWERVQRIRRNSTEPAAEVWQRSLVRLSRSLGINRPVRLFVSALVEVPTVIGWLRPVILLPLSAIAGLEPAQLEGLLAHELSHIRRHDYLVNLLQTVVETMLFYHPAVWWISGRMRHEREHCCDDLAIEICGNRAEYVRALTAMETLRADGPGLAVAARGGSLLARIRRLLNKSEPDSVPATGWFTMLIVAAAAVALPVAVRMSASAEPFVGASAHSGSDSERDFETQPATAVETLTQDPWGKPSQGLQCRLVPVASTANDEAPELKPTAAPYANSDDMTFAVELKNVGSDAIQLLGVRYGESFAPPTPGKLNVDGFGPFLFEFEFTDADGKSMNRPQRAFLEKMMMMSGMSTHAIEPTKSLVVLLRPAKFSHGMDYRLPPGTYRARVRYRGPSREVLDEIKKHWPDKPQATAWSGEVLSGEATITIAANPASRKAPELVWGEPSNGLRAALELVPPQLASKPAGPPASGDQPVPHGTKLDLRLNVQNVSDHPVQFVSETWRQDDQVTVTDATGAEQKLNATWYSGWPIMVRWTLQPREIAQLSANNVGIAVDEESSKKFEHVISRTFIAAPGKYSMRCEIRIGSIQQKDKDGNVVVPGQGDWQGSLVTGNTPFTVRVRTAADDAAVREPTFVGRLEFVGNNRRPIEKGTVEVRVPNKRDALLSAEFQKSPIEVAECTADPLTITVRAPGYEEAVIYDVKLGPDGLKQLELTPADPTRFRLVSSAAGKPIVGAKVRYFNKTSGLASSGPFPMDGIAGPVWAISGADGVVVLDTLQRVNPHYAKLGDAVYFFYVEPLNLAPQFVGPVKAGQDLGDIAIGPFLDVRGEVRGTPEELERFSAEWDQPFKLTTDNPTATWIYAVSQRLDTISTGDRLSFHLTGLRPGALRIISNFGPHPHSVSHTYGRRDPGKDDVVYETELKDSVKDLVITSQPRKETETRSTDEPSRTRQNSTRPPVASKPAPDISGRLFVTAGVRTAADSSRFVQLAIAIDPATGMWTRLQELQPGGGFTVPLPPTRVSPDGRTALFMRDKVLWKCDARTGANAVRVLERGSPAVWSSDGDYFIAAVPTKESDHQAVENWKMSSDGRRLSLLPLADGDAVQDLSPDGEWLAVTSRKDGQLYLVKADGSGRRRITSGSGDTLNDHPRFEPNGRRIVYGQMQFSGDESTRKSWYSLRTVNSDGTGDKELLAEFDAGPTPDSATRTAPMSARWSPDGKHLAVTLFDHGPNSGVLAIGGNWRLAIIDADGGNLRELKLDGILGLVLPWDGPDWRQGEAAKHVGE